MDDLNSKFNIVFDNIASELLTSIETLCKIQFKQTEKETGSIMVKNDGKLFVYPIMGFIKTSESTSAISGFVALHFNTEDYDKLLQLIFNIPKDTKGFDQAGGELINMSVGRARQSLVENGMSIHKNIPFCMDYNSLKFSLLEKDIMAEAKIYCDQGSMSLIQCIKEIELDS